MSSKSKKYLKTKLSPILSSLNAVIGKVNLKGIHPVILALILVNIFSWAVVAGLLLTRPNQANSQVDESFVADLKVAVLPSGGYETSLTWGDLGKKLVELGAIDRPAFEEIFKSPADGRDYLSILDGGSSEKIEINENNSDFVLDFLWAFGLVQKSRVLEKGPMKGGDYNFMDFASTAGWTLAAKPVEDLYSSQELVPLNDFQQDLVYKIADNVYRPCCGNSAAFPDCNHGMAALGLIELLVSAGVSEEQIYRDVLAFNSYWFPQTYLEIAAYFAKQGTSWEDVSPKEALSFDYSSYEGYSKVQEAVQDIPGLEQTGASCGV